ncbi:MAG: hypothetical protein ACRELB_01990, partial [Polyangiaceae bacterium]
FMIPARRRRPGLSLCALAASVLALAGCGFMIPQPPPATHVRAAAANPAEVAMYSNLLAPNERQSVDCGATIDAKGAELAAAADKALHDSPRPGMQVPPPSVLLAKLHAEHVSFSMQVGPNGVPVIADAIDQGRAQWRVPPQSAKERAEYAAFRAKEARVGWVVDELRLEIMGFAQAFLGAHWTAQASRSGASTLAGFVWSMQNDGMPDELVDRGRALVKKTLRCMHRGTSLEAAATGVFAAYQAAAAGDHPEIADRAIAALAASLPVKDDATDDEVDAQLAAIDAQVKDSYAKAGVTLPRGSPGVAGMQGGAAMPGGGGAGVDAAKLLPAGSPARRVADGAQAALGGDYRAAIKAVASFAPGPLGAVLGLAGSLFGG